MKDATKQRDEAATSGTANLTVQPSQPGGHESRVKDLAAVTTEFGLGGLPTELIVKIFENLVPDPLPIGTAIPLSSDIMASRKALLNLCLISKQCHKMALPLVYRNVIITNSTQTALLSVVLLTYADRRGWTRSLAMIANLDYNRHVRRDLAQAMSWLWNFDTQSLNTTELGIFHEVRAYICRLDDYIHNMTRRNASSSGTRWRLSVSGIRAEWQRHDKAVQGLYQKLLQCVMRLQPNLEEYLATVPRNTSDPYLSDESLEDDSDGPYSLPIQNQACADSESPVKTLRRVKKQANPKSNYSLVPNLEINFLRCREWEFLRDDGNWFFLCEAEYPTVFPTTQLPRHLMGLSHITELKLHETKTHPAMLWLVLSHCKSLRALCYTTKATEWNANFATSALAPAMAAGTTLQHALDQVREGLTELRVGWVPWGADLTGEELAAVDPHRVNVSGFPRLKSIDLDLVFSI